MKKILFLGLILTLILSISASAQSADGSRFRHQREIRGYRHGEITRFERRRLHHDEFRYHIARRRARRDGFVGPRERRHLAMMRMHDRRELYRFNHNNRRRLI
ncbi:MAG: hypothetical protein ACHQF0_15290 [Chitinophagales bacterium]